MKHIPIPDEWAHLIAKDHKLISIIDRYPKIGNREKGTIWQVPTAKRTSDARKIIFKYALRSRKSSTERLNFLDVGGRDLSLPYLMNNQYFYENNHIDYDRLFFRANFKYYGMDIDPETDDLLRGDICSSDYVDDNIEQINKFDVVYSNGAFEHFTKPWIAAENIAKLAKREGCLIVLIAPFSEHYHECPVDTFRYTPKGMTSLFDDLGEIEPILMGFDIDMRRFNWNGGSHMLEEDEFGGFRENWYSFASFKFKRFS